MQPDDLREIVAGNPRMRRKRRSLAARLALWVVLAVAITATAVVLSIRSVGNDSSRAVICIVAGALCWLAAATAGTYLWRSSPGRLARRAWQWAPEFQGRARDQVEPAGVRCVMANGTEHFHPWGVLAGARETSGAFHLLDANGGIRVVLPKRGLERPDQLPALREYLNRVVNKQPPAAPASTAVGEPQI